ncbi:VOC family protein [Nocardia bovistercoris]|uniref:VOC family protein n=1 Tax=Nocardia bovistercoris TaxID=2785916 RepID=A0A931IDQ5_9NOCA|nr:VOC family protein [Nocardia bovistercoris]MBH0779534.1 VOC family protein [Nocardia bovistercoris]
MTEPSTPRPESPNPPILDHLAIGVQNWSDAYDRFVHHLGGRWALGGPSGDFAPFQLSYGPGMRIEFIAPTAPDGFMTRFLLRHGPAPHHLTFKVSALGEVVDDLTRSGFDMFADRPDTPVFREMFVHPKHSGLGTLLQLVERDDEFIARVAPRDSGRPVDFPIPAVEAKQPALFGLTVSDLPRIRDLLAKALRGTVAYDGDGWFVATWGPGRSILVRGAEAAPLDPRLWADTAPLGVAFVLFAPVTLTATDLLHRFGDPVRLPHDPRTGIPVWLLP